MYTPHNPKKTALITNITPNIPSPVIDRLQQIKHPFDKTFLEDYGFVMGMCLGKSVLAAPMHSGAWHCINYTTYPDQPRFINATDNDKKPTRLGLLGPKTSDWTEVYLAEGVWDCHILNRYGFPSWGVPGVNNFDKTWLESFRGKTVYLVYDNDDPGREYGTKHAVDILTVAKEVKVLTLPDGVKDISDLFLDDPIKAAEVLRSLTISTAPLEANIRDTINGIVMGKGNNMGKSDSIAALIIKDLEAKGGAVIPYNDLQEIALVVEGKELLTDGKIDIFMSREYNCLPSDPAWRYVGERLLNHARRQRNANLNIYSAHKDNTVYMGLRRTGVLKVTEDTIDLRPQGVDSVYIRSGIDLPEIDLAGISTFIPSSPMAHLEGLLEMFHYEDRAEQQRFLIKVWLYQTFFSPVMRPILAIYGPPGCGKTLLQKILKGILFGFLKGACNPSSMPEEDHTFTLICKENKYLFLDEINDSNQQMKSKLRMLATGEEVVFRPKYARQNIRFRPQMWLSISAHSPKFRDADITQRLCIIRLLKNETMRHEERIDEGKFTRMMEPLRPQIWMGMLRDLRNIQANLAAPGPKLQLANYCRQVELAEFAWRAFPTQRKLCVSTFDGLDSVQGQFSAELDPIMDLMDDLLTEKASYAREGTIVFTAKQLHSELQSIARQHGIKAVPATSKGVAQWVHNRETVLTERYGYEKKRNVASNTLEYKFKVMSEEGF